jgi:hypothetical protein
VLVGVRRETGGSGGRILLRSFILFRSSWRSEPRQGDPFAKICCPKRNGEALRTAVAAEAQKRVETPQATYKCPDKAKDPLNCVGRLDPCDKHAADLMGTRRRPRGAGILRLEYEQIKSKATSWMLIG